MNNFFRYGIYWTPRFLWGGAGLIIIGALFGYQGWQQYNALSQSEYGATFSNLPKILIVGGPILVVLGVVLAIVGLIQLSNREQFIEAQPTVSRYPTLSWILVIAFMIAMMLGVASRLHLF